MFPREGCEGKFLYANATIYRASYQVKEKENQVCVILNLMTSGNNKSEDDQLHL